MLFEWDQVKETVNIQKHGVDFETAKEAFFDHNRLTAIDEAHSSEKETRYFCFGYAGKGVLTVRFTIRDGRVRILGAGYWRKGKKIYERQNTIH